MKINGKLLDALAILIFVAITFLFFGKLFGDNILVQTDIQQYGGMSKEIVEYRENGENIHWTNQAYGGMPTYLLGDSLYRSQNLPQYVNYVIRSVFPGVSAIFLIGLICFYILMRGLKVNRWLSIIASFCFGAGTFAITSLLAGHTSKMNAFAYAPLILAGLVYIFRKKPWAGVFLLAYGLAAQISVNHLQITFYTFLVCLIFVIAELVKALRDKQLNVWKPFLLSALGVLLAVGVNYNKLYSIYQHAKYTTRSGESLKDRTEPKQGGKDGAYDYATEWSYTPLESLTLIIPNFMGGSSNEELGEKSRWYGKQQLPRYYQTNPPTYWGQMPFTGGPVYLGAVLFALFFFGLQFVKNRWKWWVIAASLLMLMLAWGKFFPVYDAFYFGFPFFDKFRTPMMALLMLSLTIPLLSFKGVNKALFGDNTTITNRDILIGFGIPLGIVVLFGLLGGNTYSFRGAVDQGLEDGGFPTNLMKLLRADRKDLLMSDAFRSLIFIALTAGAFWAFAKEKINKNLLIGAIALLCFADLYMVNQRYLSDDLYESKANYERQLRATEIDKAIKQDKGIYRVIDVSTRNPFANALASYHHKSLGGYHAAKLQRYNDLMEFKLYQNDQAVLNMLNTKYFIGEIEEGRLGYQENKDALGNAWFVNEVLVAADDQEAMQKLSEVNLGETAIITKGAAPQAASVDSLRSITLTSYHPEKMVYNTKNAADGFAVFSEVFYSQKDGDGWHASIDGQEVPIYETNYLLRGIEVPAGEHEVVFEYKKSAFQGRGMVSRVFSGLLFLVALGYFGNAFFNRKKKEKEEVV